MLDDVAVDRHNDPSTVKIWLKSSMTDPFVTALTSSLAGLIGPLSGFSHVGICCDAAFGDGTALCFQGWLFPHKRETGHSSISSTSGWLWDGCFSVHRPQFSLWHGHVRHADWHPGHDQKMLG